MPDPSPELALIRDRLLGWGIAFTPAFPGLDLVRDIRLETTARGTDFAVVRSLDNLAQDLEVAFTTLLGSDVFNTGFGFDGLNAVAEETSRILMRERIRMSVIATLRQDPRVQRIVDVKLDDGRLEAGTPDDAERQALRASRTMLVKVEFETISGDHAVVRLGEVPFNVL